MTAATPVPQPGRVDDAVFGTEVLPIRRGESVPVVPIENTSVTRLRTDGERWLVLGVNDRHHLGDPLVP